MRPVVAGMWLQRETFDGTYTVEDLLDACEVLDVKAENQARNNKWVTDHAG